MAWIKRSLVAFTCLGLLTACSPKKAGADTHEWSVTALNGDKMTGCLAQDVKPGMLGYIDIEALPDFDVATFESLSVGLDESERTGKKRSYLVDMTNVHHPLGAWGEHREDKIKHCNAYPAPKGATEWYFSQQTGELIVKYRLFSIGDKMVFIDARTRAAKPKKEWVPNVHKD